jgi:hypothetical protein
MGFFLGALPPVVGRGCVFFAFGVTGVGGGDGGGEGGGDGGGATGAGFLVLDILALDVLGFGVGLAFDDFVIVFFMSLTETLGCLLSLVFDDPALGELFGFGDFLRAGLLLTFVFGVAGFTGLLAVGFG